MTLARIFAVIAALLMVGSFAAATLGPQDMSLGDLLSSLDTGRVSAAEQFVRTHLSNWWWERPVQSLMVRPVWIVPAMLGLLFAGGALTAASSQKAPTSRRRRS